MADNGMLGHVLERFGLTLLTVEAGTMDRDRRVSDVVLYDQVDPPEVQEGSIVLGVGVHGVDQIAELMDELGGHDACALIVREPIVVTCAIRAIAKDQDIALLSLVRGASWIQVAGILTPARHLDSEQLWPSSVPPRDGLDLFEVANSVSALLGAPVTIEDLSSHILAFSADQKESDEARKASVLGHQVPKVYNDPMISCGVFRRLYASARPIYVESIAEGVRARAAMRICAGDEVLGSIWAVVDDPLDPQRERAMIEAAGVAAIAMLRTRIATDTSRRMRTATVASLIEGGGAAREIAAKMRGHVTGGCVVAASLQTRGVADDAGASADLERAASAFLMLIHAEIPAALTAVVDHTVYAVVPAYDDTPVDLRHVRRLAQEFARRLGRDCDRIAVGVGEPVDDVAELDRSRREADLVLRVLRTAPAGPQRVAVAGEVQVQSLLLRLSDLMARDHQTVTGPIAALREYDAQHQSKLEETLRSWLDSFGDVGAAAAALHVHKNTFRYRLSRVIEVASVDLGDPEERFRLMLQFRLTA
ncbi:PucR family transcriptional regulator [Leekyejoonella antrihumi]|nr:helix-turn-helix domain-containing protein [Leekyejoonella antrihumi]